MKTIILAFLSICQSIIYVNSRICITNPFKLKDEQANNTDHKDRVCIKYSVSTFGFMDYQQKTSFVLKTMDDTFGCKYIGEIHGEESLEHDAHIAYIFKRGNCPYVEKAMNARRAGLSRLIK